MADLSKEAPSTDIRIRIRGENTLFYSTKPIFTLSCRITKYIMNFLSANKYYVGGRS